jgi:hypothetical protein
MSTEAKPVPTVGRIVHYQLSEYDVKQIEQARAEDPRAAQRPWNQVYEGKVCGAQVTAVFGESCCNLRVVLDGLDDLWATSRTEGEGVGRWSWPPRSS